MTALQKRGRSLKSTRGTLRLLVKAGEPESLDRVAEDFEKLSPSAKKELREELDKAAAALAKLRKKLG